MPAAKLKRNGMKMHLFSVLLIFQFYDYFSMDIPAAQLTGLEWKMEGEGKL